MCSRDDHPPYDAPPRSPERDAAVLEDLRALGVMRQLAAADHPPYPPDCLAGHPDRADSFCIRVAGHPDRHVYGRWATARPAPEPAPNTGGCLCHDAAVCPELDAGRDGEPWP